MQSITTPEAEFKYSRRRRNWRSAAMLAVFALVLGVLALLAVAYAQQSEQVGEVEAKNQEILSQHKAIGAIFTEQSKKFEQQSSKLQEALRLAYSRGFLAGKRASNMPIALRGLARYAVLGMLVPTQMPRGLGADHPRIETDVGGYTLRWRGFALFASKIDPMNTWTRQALEANPRPAPLGSHHAKRLIGPTGVIYAWRERGATYAVLTLPKFESAARSFVASMR